MADNSKKIMNIEKQMNTLDDQMLALKIKKQKLQQQKKKLSGGISEQKELETEDAVASAPSVTTASVGNASQYGGEANYAPKIGDIAKRTTPKKKKKKKKKKNENANPVDRYIDNL